MIIIDKGKIKVSGTKVDLLSELTNLVKGLYEEGRIQKDELEFAFKLALMTDEEFEEVDQKLNEDIKRNIEELEKKLKELFGGNKVDI